MEEILYQIALKQLEGVGAVRARHLLAHLGSAREVFTCSMHDLITVTGMTDRAASKLDRDDALRSAERELEIIDQHHLDVYFIDSECVSSIEMPDNRLPSALRIQRSHTETTSSHRCIHQPLEGLSAPCAVVHLIEQG